MTAAERYIGNELTTIVKECLEKHISELEWVKRYAREYRERYNNGYMIQPISVVKHGCGHVMGKLK